MAVEHQRAERQRLARSPSRCPAPVSIALRRLSRNRWMVRWTWKPCGTAVILAPISLSVRDVDAGDAAARIVLVVRRLDVGPAAVEPVGAVGLVALARLLLDIELGAPVGAHLLDLGLGDDALADEPLGVDLRRRRMRPDRLVHQRLGERRLVAFVVAEAPVAEHVDDDRHAGTSAGTRSRPWRRRPPPRDRRRSHGRSAPRSSWRRRTDTATSASSADRS